jgi:hypothetical protein
MSASFFALAFLAALNPKLLALDLLLIENRRPRAMFLCLLLGGLTVALAVGLVDVLAIHADAVKSQVKVGAGVDLGLGLFLLAAAGLLASGWRPRSQRPPPDPGENGQRRKKTGWAQRALAEPRLGLAMLVGALIGIPGASYLTGLHHLISSKTPAAIAVIAVVLFVFIEFLLIIIPFAFLEFRPEATKIRLKKTQDWLLTHARQLMATIALLLGAYLVINGAIRLS